MKNIVILSLCLSALLLSGCDRDKRKTGNKPKPTPSDVQKVPDKPSGLQLSAIAAAAMVAAYALSRKERAA